MEQWLLAFLLAVMVAVLVLLVAVLRRQAPADPQQQLAQFDRLLVQMRDAFGAVSANVLTQSNQQFLTLADEKFKPLREQLERYEVQLRELEKTRAEAYGGLRQQVGELQQRSEQLGSQAGILAAALRQSGPKGQWGEVSLRRIVELAGLSAHCDFVEQAVQADRTRPDLIVHLPGGRQLAIDSKVNTGAYLEAMSCVEESRRAPLLQKYAADVRQTMKKLGSKEYWKNLTPAPEFVVMFMPGEAFFAATLAEDHDLLVDGIGQGVLLASPTTLIALLLAVRHGWQQEQVAENAQKIADAGRELYERLCTLGKYMEDIRGGIQKAADAYDNAVGNWEKRTLPSARKLKELGAADPHKEIPELQPTQMQIRSVNTPEEA
ncbi:MAG: hypothetical protein HJJLKODD_02433 [Phycisphaerae bacterium]|nr:hypothetical protein [Phycisphaerae bacterium]